MIHLFSNPTAKLSAAYAPEDSLTPPPPVPRTSPDIQEMLYGDTAEDIQHMLYGDGTGDISDEEEKVESLRMAQVKEVAVKQVSCSFIQFGKCQKVHSH